MHIIARGKINWTLDILGQRPDGYHLMDMLMQPITLSDEITLDPADTISLSTSGTPAIPADESNLAIRAVKALQTATGYPGGARIHVEKHIPSGAGLGGGSADAAAVLVGLNRLWELALSTEELCRIGLTLGADVPFCIHGGLCRVGGIGETILPLADGPQFPLVILQPCEGLSTGAVFSAYHAQDDVHHPDTQAAQTALLQHNPYLLAPALGNVLEDVSRDMQPEIAEATEALLDLGAIGARMSGSGSAVFGFFPLESTAQHAVQMLSTRYETVHLCQSCRDSVVITEA